MSPFCEYLIFFVVFIWYYFCFATGLFFLCYHYMWISPRMLYIQSVDMHLYSFFASLDLDSSHFLTWWSSCWIQAEILVLYEPQDGCRPTAKVTWKVSVNMVFSWTEPKPDSAPSSRAGASQPENHRSFLTVVSLFVFITHVWGHGKPRRDDTKPTHRIIGGGSSSTHLLSITVEGPEWCTEPASVVSSQVIGVNWQRRPCKANTRIVFAPLAPPPPRKKKKGLTLLFTLPVKYYRSFM